MIERRAALWGLGTLALADRGWAADKPKAESKRLFETGALAQNPVASAFLLPEPGLQWPKDARLIGSSGRTSLEAYRGKLVIVSLWADWCGPCLTELAAMAYQCRKHTTDRFEIVPILTNSTSFSNLKEVSRFLAKFQASDLPTLIDVSNERRQLGTILTHNPADPKSEGGIPCALIIDAQGSIRGKAIGAPVSRLSDGKVWNLWGTTAGEAFVAALAEAAAQTLR